VEVGLFIKHQKNSLIGGFFILWYNKYFYRLNLVFLSPFLFQTPNPGFVKAKMMADFVHQHMGDDGADPDFIPVPRGQDQSAELVKAVRALRDEGYGFDEIVVLSSLRVGSTAETTTDGEPAVFVNVSEPLLPATTS